MSSSESESDSSVTDLRKPVGKNSSGDDLWYVEEILNHRRNEEGEVEFLIKWRYYPPAENSWEPALGLQCGDSLKKYFETHDGPTEKTGLRITIPSQTSSQRLPPATNDHRETTPSSDSDLDSDKSTASDSDDDISSTLPRDSYPSQRKGRGKNRIDSDSEQSEPDDDAEDSFGGDIVGLEYGASLSPTSAPKGKGRGKNYEPKEPEPSSAAQQTELLDELYFVPENHVQNAEAISQLKTKRKYQKGGLTTRRPTMFKQPYLNTASQEKSKPVRRLRLGEKFKPSTRHVNVTILPSADRVDDEDLGSYEDIYRRNMEEPSHLQQPAFSGPTPHVETRNFNVFLVPSGDVNALQDRPASLAPSSPPSSPPPTSSMEEQDLQHDVSPLPWSHQGEERHDIIELEHGVQDSLPSEIEEEIPKIYSDALTVLNIDEGKEAYFKSIGSFPYHFYTGESAMGQFEQSLLRAVLGRTREENDSALSDSKIVFVHKTAFNDLASATRDLRLREDLEPVFILYGSDGMAPVQGPQEIYPYGGIVTLTSEALTSNPDLVIQKLQEIAEHPLWAVYILPSALAKAVKKFYGDIPVWENLDDNFAFIELIEMIDNGLVALMDAPGDAQEWVVKQMHTALRDPSETLKACSENLGRLESEESSVSEEVVQNLQKLQALPQIFQNYRRFVVLTDGDESLAGNGASRYTFSSARNELTFPNVQIEFVPLNDFGIVL